MMPGGSAVLGGMTGKPGHAPIAAGL